MRFNSPLPTGESVDNEPATDSSGNSKSWAKLELAFARKNLSYSLPPRVSYGLQKKPKSFFSVILGVVTFSAGILYAVGIYFGLGAGRMEKMLLNPMLVWAKQGYRT